MHRKSTMAEETKVKRKKGKKRKISKHIVASASERKERTSDERTERPAAEDRAADDKNSDQQSKKVKKRREKDPVDALAYLQEWKDESSTWKFNRHMYNDKLVSKSTFGMLLQYLVKAEHKVHERLRTEAIRRALRYQKYTTNPTATVGNDDDEYKILNDHDKRKEYKRARKVLDTIRKQQQQHK